MSRDRRLVGGVHALRERAEVVVEEPGVDVEGHRCGGVTEHPLDRLDVRATGHQQARGGVPEVVRAEVIEPGAQPGRQMPATRPSTAHFRIEPCGLSREVVAFGEIGRR